MDHCKFLRRCISKFIDYIEGEVEGIRILKLYFDGSSRFTGLHIYPLLPDTGAIRLPLHFLCHRCISHRIQFRNGCTGWVEDYGIELTILSSHGNHSMGNGGVEVTGVPRVEGGFMFPHLNKKFTGNTDIEFLSVMACQLDIIVFSLFLVLTLDIQRFCDSSFERVGQVEICHSIGGRYLLAFPTSCDGNTFQFRAVSLDDISYIHSKSQSTTIDEGEVKVCLSAFTFYVLFPGNLCFGCHFIGGEAFDLSQILNSAGHLPYLVIKTCNGCFHFVLRFGTKKSSQRIFFL